MASHGVPRVAEQPRTQEDRDKEQNRIDQYQALVSEAMQKTSENLSDQAALETTSKLLKQNPEYYTVWNIRRRMLLAQIQEVTEQELEVDGRAKAIVAILSGDLMFLVPLMQKYPKCYWLWNHRAWLLQQASARLPLPAAINSWTQELGLVNKMLQQDKRNFHGWGYRRKVITELERLRRLEGLSETEASLVEEEYEYTRKMIGQDLSNFSAWHARSNLILRMLREKNASEDERKAILDQELDLIHDALIDPRDQSLWFYHQFLMTTFDPDTSSTSIAPALSNEERLGYLTTEITYVLEALEGAEEVKWVYLSLIQLAYAHWRLSSRWPESASQEQVTRWLQMLRELDAGRSQRWHDWGRKIGLTS